MSTTCISVESTAAHCNTLQHTATHCNTYQQLSRNQLSRYMSTTCISVESRTTSDTCAHQVNYELLLIWRKYDHLKAEQLLIFAIMCLPHVSLCEKYMHDMTPSKIHDVSVTSSKSRWLRYILRYMWRFMWDIRVTYMHTYILHTHLYMHTHILHTCGI